MKLTLAEWLSEREANARQISASKHGIDKADWLEDAEYFKQAAALAAPSTPAAKPEPTFVNVYCSQCGRDFGPGEHGFSHCRNHAGKASK